MPVLQWQTLSKVCRHSPHRIASQAFRHPRGVQRIRSFQWSAISAYSSSTPANPPSPSRGDNSSSLAGSGSGLVPRDSQEVLVSGDGTAEKPTKSRYYGSAFRRSQRNLRAPSLPSFVVPPWFSQRNVRYHKDLYEQEQRANQEYGIDKGFAFQVEFENKSLSKLYLHLHQLRPDRFIAGPPEHKLGKDKIDTTVKDVRCDPDPYIYIEIRSCVAACLSAYFLESQTYLANKRANITLHCPSKAGGPYLNSLVELVAIDVGADVISIDALDLAELASAYFDHRTEDVTDLLSTLGYSTYHSSQRPRYNPDTTKKADEEKPDNYPEGHRSNGSNDVVAAELPEVTTYEFFLQQGRHKTATDTAERNTTAMALNQLLNVPGADVEDRKLTAFLEAIVDASADRQMSSTTDQEDSEPTTAINREMDAEQQCADSVSPLKPPFKLSLIPHAKPDPAAQKNLATRKTIIHVKDITDLGSSQIGALVLNRLTHIIERRRAKGERMMLIATTCTASSNEDMTESRVKELQLEGDETHSRTIVVPYLIPRRIERDFSTTLPNLKPLKDGSFNENMAVLDINVRHLKQMLNRIDPELSLAKDFDVVPMRESNSKSIEWYQGVLGDGLLSSDEIHRLVTVAFGLYGVDSAAILRHEHIELASRLLQRSDKVKSILAKRNEEVRKSKESGQSQSSKRIESIRKTANKYEKKLMSGIIDPSNIRTSFNDVHAPAATIEALRMLTTLSLIRPEAFQYGVLATDSIPGLLLYGPPGTGKTLLAKAVAKESGATVLDISGSEINEMYVGESEKNTKAVFSLATKLSPCVVFIDEADAIFASRSGSRNRTSHRDVLNQFLKEWDGMSNRRVFIMVATNRPFDLDDAVLRRLPRRLLVDLPTKQDRESILAIHLKDEKLDDSVSIADLAERTPLYSGSDLKNLAVAAALICVKEETEAAKAAVSNTQQLNSNTSSDKPKSTNGANLFGDYSFPKQRTLESRHFDRAMDEIGASINEDMGSLTAIRKFDEKFGDRKGRRAKSSWGFELTDSPVDSETTRVRT